MEWAGVILAGGLGVRMRSRTPKILHPVCGVPMVQHVVTAMRAAGVDRLVVVASPQVAELPELRKAIGEDAVIAVQPERLGTANALMEAREACDGARRVLSVHGDAPLLTLPLLEALMEAHLSRETPATIVTAHLDDPTGLGRVQRGEGGTPVRVVEEADADAATLSVTEINSGCYAFEAVWLWEALERIEPSASGECYLTDIVSIAAGHGYAVGSVSAKDPADILGVNDRSQLADVEALMRDRIRRHWMLSGVTLRDPATTYIDVDTTIGVETVILPGTHLTGRTEIGEGCEIGPGTVLRDCRVGDHSKVFTSHGEEARVGRDVSIGPFSRLRSGTVIEDGVYVGNYAEIKNSQVGTGAHIGHFSYLGDADVGRNVNIGAGTVTCNFDGETKHQTVIEDGAFIGSGSMLVAPVTIGKGAVTGAGAVVTRSVPADSRVVGVPARVLGADTGTVHSGEKPQEA